MRRSPIRPRRATPRRRLAPQWTASEWAMNEPYLQARAMGCCECCGAFLNGQCERHHRMRRRDGGDRLSNLLLLLPACHVYWTAHPEEARERGLIILTSDDPLVSPVLWRGETWSVLDDDGLRRLV